MTTSAADASQSTRVTRKPGFRLAVVAFCCAAVVVSLGAFTRLSDAGLGCPDWPGCYGHLLWPRSEHHVQRAEELFPHAPVEHDKTWPEMVHRYFAGTLGLLIAGLAVGAWRRRDNPDQPMRLPLLLAVLVVWQALFGMWTVTLKLWPQIVVLHLLGGFTVLTLLWVLVMRLGNRPWRVDDHLASQIDRLKPWVVAAIVLVAAQILLGGWLSANYAAYACPDFPQCHRSWLPPMDMAAGFDIFQTIGPNYLGGQLENEARVAIHFTHRVGAILVTLYLLAMAVRLVAVGDGRLTLMAAVIAGALALQLTLGVANVFMRIPLSVAVAHNAGGALLLLTVVTLASRIWMAQMPKPEETK